MAREIRVERREPLVGPAARRAGELAEPRTTEEARQAIEATRGRISETLDAIETRLEDRKARLKERADVLRPVSARIRERPWPSVGIAATVGLLAGILRGRGRRAD